FFFFQAEDGIRDFHVTGVQTCALPIWRDGPNHGKRPRGVHAHRTKPRPPLPSLPCPPPSERVECARSVAGTSTGHDARRSRVCRSEERRVGKEWRARGLREQAQDTRNE